MQHQALLENYLRQLRLSTFAQNYQTFAQDATRTNLSYERYLLALCQAEAEQREANRIERAILNAKFPLMKELGSFDFSLVQGITKTRVLELSQGGYLSQAENVILNGRAGYSNRNRITKASSKGCALRYKQL
jgi:DNA replication protein DnaC